MASSQEPAQDKGFRTSLLGFDKNDVLAYVNALANEAQQQELTYQQQLRDAQAQAADLTKERNYAQACSEKMRAEVEKACARADAAEKKVAEAANQRALTETQNLSLRKQCEQQEETIQRLNAQIAALQQQVAQLTAQPAAAPAADSMPAPVPQPAPRRVEPAAKNADLYDRARVEARRILEDARISAEAAQRRMDAEAAQRKQRMAENARGIAAGVMILRDRIARVDDTLASVSMELDNATDALYKALEDTSADLQELDAGFKEFVNGTPETSVPKPPPAGPVPPVAPKPAPQPPQPKTVPVPSPTEEQPQAQPMSGQQFRPKRKAVPVRLRSSAGNRRVVAQNLSDAASRIDRDKK